MLTPLDIENKRLSKQRIGGYSIDEVDDFLDEVTIDYEVLYKENAELKSKLEDMEKSVQHYKIIEETLQNTLLMAQTTAEEVRTVANQKAEQIIQEAKNEAQKTVDELNSQIMIKKYEYEDIAKQFDVYKAKMESLLISQLELLKDVNNKD